MKVNARTPVSFNTVVRAPVIAVLVVFGVQVTTPAFKPVSTSLAQLMVRLVRALPRVKLVVRIMLS